MLIENKAAAYELPLRFWEGTMKIRLSALPFTAVILTIALIAQLPLAVRRWGLIYAIGYPIELLIFIGAAAYWGYKHKLKGRWYMLAFY